MSAAPKVLASAVLSGARALGALLLATSAHAFDTVDVTVHELAIQAGSLVTGSRYDLLSGVTQSWELDISGQFELHLTHYGFSCSATPFGNICADQFDTLQLLAPQFDVDTAPERAFTFPVYRSTFNNPPNFTTNNGPCAVTLPGEHCSGTSSGPLSTMTGSFDGFTLLLTGIDPGAFIGDVDYAYDIEATISAVTVPLPGAAGLLLLPMAWLGRRRDTSVRSGTKKGAAAPLLCSTRRT